MERCPVPRPAQVVRTASDVEVGLNGRVLQYEVEERFVNRGDRVGEADFLFPLPKGAAFQDLKLSIDGQLIAGEILPADQARGIYEEIVRRQRDPALVEWMGRGLLRTRIFPIAPGEEKRVVVRFQSVAEREGDAVRVDYFTGVRGPGTGVRWGGGRIEGDDRSGSDGPRTPEPGPRTRFTFSYPDDGSYGTAYSPTHALDARARGGRRIVEARGGSSELTILLPVRASRDAAISVIPHAPGREDGFALITLTPPARRARATPRDVTFVVDVSGSMSGVKLSQAKAAGKQLLSTLHEGDRFRIIDFASGVRTFRDDFVPATRSTIAEAGRYLDSLDAEGGTNIEGALREALGGRSSDDDGEGGARMPVVLFVTDGAPSVGERRPEALAEQAASRRGRARLFTFGVGADVNVALLEQLALEGRGTAQFVRPEESVERMVGIVASRLADPLVTDVRIRAEGARLSRMHPDGPIDVFAGQDLVVLARYEGSGDATIRFDGRTSDGPVSWTQRVSLPERERGNAFVPRLWATQRIGYLSAERRRHGGNSELDTEIRELGERYGIPTEFSSYLVLEPGMVVANQSSAGRGVGARQLSEVVTTGAAAAPAPEMRDASRRERAFAAAKLAGEQRAATSLAGIDTAAAGLPESGGATRRADGRIFVHRDGVWVDAGYKEGMRTVKVRAFSAAYFAIVDRLPELRSALAVGDRVIVAGRAVAIEVGAEGTERLDEAELARLARDW